MKPYNSLRRGMVIDRCQPRGIPPAPSTFVDDSDMAIIKQLGFDHVKILLTPSSYMKDDRLDPSTLWYAENLIGKAVKAGLHCLVCIHPEPEFKRDYLASRERFRLMLDFYREFSAWLAGCWDKNQISFQLMTEPFANYTDWNELHPQIWETVRDKMPEHTLVISGDKVGSLFGLITTNPVPDGNVYYGYTSYDPIPFTMQSWNSFFCGLGPELDCIGRLPYPASPEIVEDLMPRILMDTPPELHEKAAVYARDYGQGNYLHGNHGLFDAQWHERRMELLENWRRRHKSHLPILCNEFGAMDHVAGKRFGGPGCVPEDRIRFIRDLREAMERHDVGWSYWSFNETFTIFLPEERKPNAPIDIAIVDRDLLEALGMQ